MARVRVPQIPTGLNKSVVGSALTLSFKWNRSRGWNTLAVTIAGLVVLVLAAIYLISGTASWFVVAALLIYVPVALLWGGASLADLLNVTTVHADLDLVNVTTGPISSADANTSIRVDDLDKVFAHQVRRGTKERRSMVNEVKAITRQGEEVTLVAGITDRATAVSIAYELTQHLEIEA